MSNAATQTIYSFGTSGYRNDTEEGFSEAVVRQITQAISDYVISTIEEQGKALPVIIGGDTREKTRRFIPLIGQILLANGLDVYQADGDLPTPVLAYAAKHFDDLARLDNSIQYPYTQTAGAILMTASHNPWAYGGFNFLTPDAAVAPTPVTKAFEKFQKEPANFKLDRARYNLPVKATLQTFDAYPLYQRHLKNHLKLDYAAIEKSGVQIFYDPLYATGRNYLPRLLSDEGIQITTIHATDVRPAGYTGMPEPTGSNLTELKEMIVNSDQKLKLGLANDGDADRFGIMDERGEFIIPNDVLALVLYHLIRHRHHNKGLIARSQASSHILDALAESHGLNIVQTPVGYKYIAEEFIDHENSETPVILGGEGSGGLSIGGHIPEKDGLLANLLIAELVALEGKPLSEILKQVKASLANQFVSRELSITTEKKADILSTFTQFREKGGQFAQLTVDVARSKQAAEKLQSHFGTTDGIKLYLNDGSWILTRVSGTEPIARVYIETVDTTEAVSSEKNEALYQVILTILTNTLGIDSGSIKVKY